MFFTRVIKVLVIVVVAFAFASVVTAFAATNTFTGTAAAGDGSTTISGFAISAVHYTLNATNPANIDSVSFTASPAPGQVSIQLDGSTWVSCTVSGTTVTCPGSGTTGVTALNATNLRVVAAQ